MPKDQAVIDVAGAIGVLPDETAVETSKKLYMPKDLESIQKIEDTIENEFEKLGLLLDEGSRGDHHEQGDDNNEIMGRAIEDAIGALKLNLLQCAEGPCQELLELAPATTRITVAADTGAVRNVINPKDLPRGAEPNGVITTHFVGASDEHIENYGEVDTMLSGSGLNDQTVACNWCAADVSKALHSISETTGPFDGPGTHDVLFNNRLGVVVPLGIVNMILKRIKPLLTYDRRGGLYCADLEVSSFPRPGQKQ